MSAKHKWVQVQRSVLENIDLEIHTLFSQIIYYLRFLSWRYLTFQLGHSSKERFAAFTAIFVFRGKRKINISASRKN